MSDEDDPFERLGADVEDRDGDPFESLEDIPEKSADDRETDPMEGREDTGGSLEDDEFSPPGGDGSPRDGRSEWNVEGEFTEVTEPELGTGTGPNSGTVDESGVADAPTDADPFADVGGREGDPFESLEGEFESVEPGIDPEQVWERLEGTDDAVGGEARKRIYAEVSKHSYCKQCEHFSKPPDVNCTYEGTQIVEFLDMDTVRLVDCPIVAERKELGEHEE